MEVERGHERDRAIDVMELSETIRIAAAIILNDRGQMLVVRKRGTSAFIQPGGKIERGESPRQALERELVEELGCSPRELAPCGHYSAPAVHEVNRIVEADFFFAAVNTNQIAPAAEIAEIRWIDPATPSEIELAPLTALHAVPLAAEKVQRDISK